MAPIHDIHVKRIYEDPDADDGVRVLVDRLWPRGLKKESAHLDEWCKDVAPSKELRTWYDHEASRYEEFTARYAEELGDAEHRAALERIRELADGKVLTLLTATKHIEGSQVPSIVAALKQ